MGIRRQKILVYCWDGVTEKALCRAFGKMNLEIIKYTGIMKDYHADSDFAVAFIDAMHKENITCVFSYNYFPLIAMICEVNHIPYISWIYDCPLLTIYSKTIISPYNYIFSFDEILTQKIQKLGAERCFSMPLAGDADILNGIEASKKYACDISFVGGLYNEGKNRIRKHSFSDYTTGYIDGLAEAQLRVYGYNFIKECLNDEIVAEIADKCDLHLNGDMYFQDETQLVANAIGMEVSTRERENILQSIGTFHVIDLYTGSKIPDKLRIPNIRIHGRADYEKEMPSIFNESRINLNITSSTIESGIPLRIFDILSAGGFCMTNYRPEIAKYFQDGVDLVIFSSVEDMLMKIDYYLEHDDERKEIASNGYQTLKKYHTFEQRIKTIMDTVF